MPAAISSGISYTGRKDRGDMAEVAYNRETYNKCLCGGCPVNRSSDCVARLEVALDNGAIEKEGKMPDAASMPGAYCATDVGKSACEDLDEGKSCLCPACPVHIGAELAKSHYCINGSAKEVG